MSIPSRDRINLLLREGGWLRHRLERSISDGNVIDDVIQQTWLAAIESLPPSVESVSARRSWLAQVARNVVGKSIRSEVRRTRREKAVAADEIQRPDVLETLDLLERLIQCMRLLSEPYQSTLVMRYWKGLPIRELAAREGVSIHAIKARLNRGHKELRRLMVDPKTERSTPAWIHFVLGPIRGLKTIAGGIILTLHTKLVVGVMLALLSGALAIFFGSQHDPEIQLQDEIDRLATHDKSAELRPDRVELSGTRVLTESEVTTREIAPWRVSGVVENEDQHPIPSAHVIVERRQGDVTEFIGKVVANDDGRFDVSLEPLRRLGALTLECSTILILVSAPNYLAKTESFDAPLLGVSQEFEFKLVRGGSILGRVVSRSGKPVLGARVVLADESEAPGRWVENTNAEGDFRIPIRVAAIHRVHAGAFEVGVATSSPFDATPSADVYLPDLILQGEGFLAGNVVDPRGDPVSDLEIFCVREGVEPALNPFVPQSLVGDEGGLLRGRAITQSNGRFRIEGLAPGRYKLSIPRGQWKPPVDDCWYTTDREDLSFVVERHRLLIQVVDSGGTAVPGTQLWLQVRHPNRPHQDSYSAQVSGKNGISAFHFSPGTRVIASARIGSHHPIEGEATIEENPYDTWIRLELSDIDPPPGSLFVRLRDEETNVISDFTLTLRTKLSRAPLAGFYHRKIQSKELPPIPEGSYDIEIQPGPGTFRGNTIGWYFPIHEEVHIRAGEEALFERRVRRGGRFSLCIHLPEGTEQDLEDVDVDQILANGEGKMIHPFISDRPEGQYTSPIRFSKQLYTALHLFDEQMLRVRIRVNGFREAEVTIPITRGETFHRDVYIE